MPNDELAQALTREHRDIDAGIEEFLQARETGTTDPAPLHGAFDALRRHIYLEEKFLFPPLREAGMTMPIMVMLREHGALWNAMDRVDERLADPESADRAEGSDGARTQPDLATLCQELLAALDAHNSKEEPIIYPRAGVDLDEYAYTRLRDFVADGRLPEGWVCATAG